MRYLLLFLLVCSCATAWTQRARLSPHLQDRAEQRKNLNGSEKFLVHVHSTRDFLQRYNGRIEVLHSHPASGGVTFSAPYTLLFEEMANDGNVYFIEVGRMPHEESLYGNADFRSNRVRKVQHDFPHLNGDGKIVSVKERKYDPDDIDLVGKTLYLGLESEQTSRHATEMATKIAGAGNTSPRSTGVTPAARLVPSDFSNLLPDNEHLLASNNVFVQNHAYGVEIENYYGVEAYSYDYSVFSEPHLLHVFSAGNAGMEMAPNGKYAGLPFANLTGNFKHAKNVLTVSALDTTFTVSEYNSRGPAYDGRLKPELVAYGGGGTSDAAAIVSGVAVLLQQAFSGKTGVQPEVSMLKAILIASAEDTGTEGIDFYSGYGNVNAASAVTLIENAWFERLLVRKGEESEVEIVVPEDVYDLRLVVSWVDPPASSGSDHAIVNDVNAVLELEANQWHPWVLNDDANVTALNAKPVRMEDHLNNNEFFSFKQPAPGTYVLKLQGGNMLTDQQVSIAWFYQKGNKFEWDFPTASDPLKAGTNERIHWNSTFESSIGDLSYRFAGGEWISLGAVDLHSVYRWDVPDTSAFAQLKMTVSDEEHLSDSFLISAVPEVSVAFNCEEKIGFQWKAIEEASAYQVYEMNELQLELIGVSEDTFFTLPKNEHVFYAVAPMVAGVEGMRSAAVNYTFQGAFCYFNFFAAERYDEKSIRLVLNLSSAIGIEGIEILKSYGAEEKLFSSFDPGTETSFILLDFELQPGLVLYKAVLHFSDGFSLKSDVSSVYIEKEGAAILFPNPTHEDHINILTSGTGQILRVTDRKGTQMMEKELLTKEDILELHSFRAGLYLYQLIEEGRVIDEGKFVKY